MSQRGLALALQRLHDDPGFGDMVQQDPQNTLGIYDLDDTERQSLEQAIRNDDLNIIQQLAASCGMDWKSQHVHGVGALSDEEISTEGAAKPGIDVHISPGDVGGPLRPA
jgi:hypothetical protein